MNRTGIRERLRPTQRACSKTANRGHTRCSARIAGRKRSRERMPGYEPAHVAVWQELGFQSVLDELLLGIHRAAAARLLLALESVGADVLDFPQTAGWTHEGVGRVITLGVARSAAACMMSGIVSDLRKRKP